jgi:aryl-alcohol dehydrogenase-like predicted oxidoreductase
MRDAAPSGGASSRVERARLPHLTDRVTLGRSGLRVSPFCLGMVGDPAVVLDAFDAGINFFFLTADMHWPLYEGTRLGLTRLLAMRPGARDQLVVAVASYVTQPEFSTAPFEEVLDAVAGLEHVDLAVIGGAYPNDFFGRLAEYEARRPGRARALGATFHHRQSAVTAVNRGLVDLAFVRYNSAHWGAEQDVLPHLSDAGIARLFSFNAASGHVLHARLSELGLPETRWRPKLVDHYRFALSAPRIDGLLCSLTEREHVAELAAAVAAGPLSDAERNYLKTLCSLDAGDIALAPGT